MAVQGDRPEAARARVLFSRSSCRMRPFSFFWMYMVLLLGFLVGAQQFRHLGYLILQGRPSALPTETAGAADPQRGLSEKTREQVEMHPEKPQGRRVNFKKAREGGQKGYGMQVAWQNKWNWEAF